MPITPINSNTTSSASAAGPQSQLDMTEFLKLLTVQLSTQDPLNPMKDTEFFSQLAQLGTVQGMDSLKNSFDVTQAASLMGKTVTAVSPGTDNGTGISSTMTGVVKRLTIQNGQYLLDIQGTDGSYSQVKMANVQEISN